MLQELRSLFQVIDISNKKINLGIIMRYLFLFLALLSSAPAVYAFDKQKMLESFFSTVMVRGYKADGSLAFGSGVVVGDNKVLTNCHTLRQTKQPWISQGEDTYTITSVQADRWHDVCLVGADTLPFKAVALGKAGSLKKGQEVVAIGHSSGVPTPLTSVGVVKSLFSMNEGNIIRSTARFALGASGSGLYDSEGRLVGINTLKTVGRAAYYYAMPVEWLAELKKQKVETEFPITGDAFWEAEEEERPFFMQVAVPEINEDWAKLAEVAGRWIKAEPNSSEAWFEAGVANENMGKQAEAEQAYRKSVSLDASNTDSLFRIGVIASAKGDKKEVHAVNLTLLNIDKDAAAQFEDATGCKVEC
jgi:serine protease Do